MTSSPNLMKTRKTIALWLYDLGAVQFGAFKLKLHEENPLAPLSPIFLNLRTSENPKPGPLTPDIVALIGRHMLETAKKLALQFDAVAGVPRAGDPFAKALCRAAKKSFRHPPPCLKLVKTECGEKRRITGVEATRLEKRSTVLLVDDLITKAGSKFEAIGVLERQGFIVRDVLVLVDREQGGAQQLADRGYRLYAALLLSEMLRYYTDEKKISKAQAREVACYLRENR